MIRNNGKTLLTVGVTGPTGAGKSSLRGLTEELGFVWLDTDITAREIVEPGMPALAELAERFGQDIIRQDGTLDRALLASRAFPTAEGCTDLNAITHPRVAERLRELIADAFAQGKHAVIDAPLLFESGIDAMCDETVAVLAPAEMRMERIMVRDGLTEEQAMMRIKAQKPDEFYSGSADHTVDNSAGLDRFLFSASAVFADILHRYNIE